MINRIRDIRREKGWTLADLAEACDPPTTAQTIGRLETGMRNLSIKWMDRIGAALGVAPDSLVRADATDHPQIEKKEIGEAKIGGGPVLHRGSIISPVVFNLLRKTAEKKKIPYTVQAAGRDTSTDADAIHIAREGVATALVSVPNRYMHSPNEMVSLADVDHIATLLAEACRSVNSKTDFTDR